MALGGPGTCLLLTRKIFENLDAVMAISELVEQFLWQILFNFLPLTLVLHQI